MPGSLAIDKDLNPTERKIAMMRVAGATIDSIAYMLEVANGTIEYVLRKPHVANYILLLTAYTGRGIEEGIRNLNEAIDSAATEAFDIEMKSMRELDSLGDDPVLLRPPDRIKAKVAASTIAQDILDRAGKRAPTRVINAQLHGTIPEAALARVSDVLSEINQTIDVTPHQPTPVPPVPAPGRIFPFPAPTTSQQPTQSTEESR